MPSVEVRLVLFAILFVIFLAIRLGWFKKLKDRRAEKAAAEAAELRRHKRRAKLAQMRQRQEVERRRTEEILLRAAPGLRQKSVVAAGLETWYLEQGQADSPVVLLLHGFAGGKEDWAGVATRLLAAGFRVIAPDLPGCGQSHRDSDLTYDVTAQVKRVRAFTQQLGLGRLHAVGCSMGATIAAAYAYAAPADVLSLTLIEPLGVRVPYSSELAQLLAQDRNPLVVATPQAYDNLLGFIYSTVPELPPGLKQHRAEQAAAHRVFNLKMWKEISQGERANLLDLLLPVLKVRTLVLLGGDSRVVHGATAEVVRAMMPDRARTAVIDGCGHFPMVERPEETAEHLLGFLGPAVPASSPPAPDGPPATA